MGTGDNLTDLSNMQALLVIRDFVIAFRPVSSVFARDTNLKYAARIFPPVFLSKCHLSISKLCDPVFCGYPLLDNLIACTVSDIVAVSTPQRLL